MDEFEAEVAILNELRARTPPEYRDTAYTQGIFTGLEIAWRIVTDTPNGVFINWDGTHGCHADGPDARIS